MNGERVRTAGVRLGRTLRWIQRGNRVLIAVAALVGVFALAHGAHAAAVEGGAEGTGALGGSAAGFLAAALAVGLACAGAGYAVAHVGASSVGAMSERPELAGRALIFIGLAEGIAIYGLIVSVMILGRL